MNFKRLKSLLALAVVGAVVLSSCSKEEGLAEKESPEAGVDSRLAKITITAFNGEEEPASKTILAGDELKQVHWLAKEEIAVFDYKSSDEPNKFTSTNTEQSATATFDGSIAGITDQNELEGKEFIGLYPYNANATISADGTISTTLPDVQEAVANSFASNLMITMGKSTSNATKMKFFNVCGGLCFTVQHDGISHVVIKSQLQPIAGDFTVKFEEVDGKEIPVVKDITKGKYVISITAPDDGYFVPGKQYYIVTLPVKIGEVLKIWCNEAYASCDYYIPDGTLTLGSVVTYYSEIIDPEGIEFKRSVFARKRNVDERLIYDGVEYVDLGLPSGNKWAAANVGANLPEAFGDYFAWGERKPKENYVWPTYKWCEYNYSNNKYKLTKYNTSEQFGNVDGQTILERSDWAYDRFGYEIPEWSVCAMPTKDDWDELEKYCEWVWIEDYISDYYYDKVPLMYDVNGYLVYSKKNQGVIFLPAAGFYIGINRYGDGDYGNYWSSSLSPNSPEHAIYATFGNNSVSVSAEHYRNVGHSVRLVMKQ